MLVTSNVVIFTILVGLVEGHTRLPFSSQCRNNPAGPLSPLPHLTICPPAIDDDELDITGPRVPWSFKPWCVRPGKELGSKLCAYTVSSVRGGGGMSIVTTPDVAANIANEVQDPDIAWLEKKRRSPFAPDPHKPYELKEVPGKGIGVFATKQIRESQILMAGLPLLVRLAEQKTWPQRSIFETLQHASTRLPMVDKEKLLSLARSGKGYIVDDIMTTNSFQITVSGVEHSGLYPEIARINHHCRPNAFVRYSPGTLIVEAVAYKDIPPEEEISLSYLPLNLLSWQRKELLAGWAFNCSCSLCSDPEATQTSDRNRNRIQDVLESLDYTGNRTQAKVRAVTEEVEYIAEEEGLAGQMGDFYSIIADVYLDMGDLEMARQYGKLALKMLRYYAGYDNVRTDVAMEFMEDLEKEEGRSA